MRNTRITCNKCNGEILSGALVIVMLLNKKTGECLDFCSHGCFINYLVFCCQSSREIEGWTIDTFKRIEDAAELNKWQSVASSCERQY